MIGQKGIPAQYGGVEKAVEEVAARLVQRGHDVTAFNSRDGGPRPRYHRGIRLRYVPVMGGKHLHNFTQSLNATMSTLLHDYDIVHYHALGPTLASPIARLRRNARLIVTIQGRDDQRAKWSRPAKVVLGTAAWVAANVPHRKIAVSQRLQDEFRNEFDCESVHIPNGVNEPGPAPDYTPDELPEAFGLEAGNYLINVGRLVPEKAVDTLIQAYKTVPGDVKLAIVGGSSHTDSYVERLHELAAEDERVILTGPVYGNGIDSLYRHAAGYVMPSKLEGLPLVLLEGISYGLPVAVSDIPPHLEVVHENGPGHRVFPVGDTEEMAKKLTEIVTDLEGERTAAKALTTRVLEEYSWESITDRVEACYLDAFDRAPQVVPVA